MANCSIQLIDGDAVFNVTELEHFTKSMKLDQHGLSYAIVSIMGSQSSGKSTLLNHLFGTNFREMDAFRGRSKTTRGIWLGNCAAIKPCTIVLDLEGTDGRERGEDDTAFEKKSALFAFAVSDIVLINMWCHDIGRKQARNTPLLKTVFQAMLRLFSRRKTTLLFVIRDKTGTPLENLESILREDIRKIWDNIPKPLAYQETPLSEFFNVQVVALSSYEETEEQFKEEVASLRQKFYHSIAPSGLAGDRRGVIPASGFSFSAQQIWKVIKENKYLDLSAHKLVHPAYPATWGCIRAKSLDDFKESLDKTIGSGEGFAAAADARTRTIMLKFDKGCEDTNIEQAKWVPVNFSKIKRWDPSKVRYKLQRDIDGHLALVRTEILSEIMSFYEEKLSKTLLEPVEVLLDAGNDDTWPTIRKLLQKETSSALSGSASELASFDLDNAAAVRKIHIKLEDYAKNLVESKAREEARYVLIRMKDRFLTFFRYDDDFMPRIWTSKEDIKAITKTARSASLKLLSVMAAIRLNDEKDKIQDTLSAALLDASSSCATESTDRSIQRIDLLASSSWEEIPLSKTLITPDQCKSLWMQFKTETEYIISQAISDQKVNRRNNSMLPTPWTVGVMLVVGFCIFKTCR